MQAILGPDHTWDNISIKDYLPPVAIFTSCQIANLEKSIKRERGYGAWMVACAKATLFRPNFSPGIAAAANMPHALAKFGCKRSEFYLHRFYKHGKWGEWNGLVGHNQNNANSGSQTTLNGCNCCVDLWTWKMPWSFFDNLKSFWSRFDTLTKILVTLWHIDQVLVTFCTRLRRQKLRRSHFATARGHCECNHPACNYLNIKNKSLHNRHSSTSCGFLLESKLGDWYDNRCSKRALNPCQQGIKEGGGAKICLKELYF